MVEREKRDASRMLAVPGSPAMYWLGRREGLHYALYVVSDLGQNFDANRAVIKRILSELDSKPTTGT